MPRNHPTACSHDVGPAGPNWATVSACSLNSGSSQVRNPLEWVNRLRTVMALARGSAPAGSGMRSSINGHTRWSSESAPWSASRTTVAARIVLDSLAMRNRESTRTGSPVATLPVPNDRTCTTRPLRATATDAPASDLCGVAVSARNVLIAASRPMKSAASAPPSPLGAGATSATFGSMGRGAPVNQPATSTTRSVSAVTYTLARSPVVSGTSARFARVVPAPSALRFEVNGRLVRPG